MSKKPSFFRQLPPPQLQKVLSITQPQKQLIAQHWKQLFSAIETEIIQGSKSTIVVYKADCHLAMVCFQEGCLTYQRKFKIMYGQIQEITCLKIHSAMVKHKQLKKRELVVMVGFMDGAVELYHLIVTDKTVVLKKYLSFQSALKEPVTNLVIHRGSMIASRLHQVQLYNEAITCLVDLIVEEMYSKEGKSSSGQINCKVSNFGLKEMAEGMAVSISQGKQCLHVYNESEGSKTFLIETMVEYGSITDSISFMLQLLSENLVIGDTNDKLKIIYKRRNIVERFRGFKNYCSDGCHLLFPTHEELWVGDYNGSVTYLTKGVAEEEAQKSSILRVIDKEVHFSTKVCEYGIKKLAVSGKLLIVLDTQSNLHFFDIIRKQTSLNSTGLNVQSVNSHSEDD